MRSTHLLCGLALVAALSAGAARLAAAAEAPACAVPRELLLDDPKLKLAAEKFRTKAPLTIVAIGGASTAGTAAGDGTEFAYPHRLEEALRERHAGMTITVLNKGVPRQTTQEMAARFAADVVAADPPSSSGRPEPWMRCAAMMSISSPRRLPKELLRCGNTILTS